MSGSGPIIITGADRSGTTLLYALLASHSQISMVRRTNMWRWFYGQYGDLAEPANLDECLATMMRYTRLGVLQPDPDAIRSAFRLRPPTYGQLFAVMHEQHATRRGRRRWGDKSLHTEHYAAQIFSELPDARILHMVRDPRDRYASILRRYESDGKPAKGVAAAMGRWRASVRAGQRNLADYGEARYTIVRYETLATSPEATMRRLCDFIGEPYEPEMLEMRGIPDVSDYSGNSSFDPLGPGEISTRSIGRFRRTLDARTIALIDSIAGRQMNVCDYAASPTRLSASDRARLWGAELPVEAIRTLGWLVTNRFGAERSRTVPAHRLSNSGNGVSIP
jgi:hypothetical protein